MGVDFGNPVINIGRSVFGLDSETV